MKKRVYAGSRTGKNKKSKPDVGKTPTSGNPTPQTLELSEAQLQAQCFRWHWDTFPEYRRLLFHIPNGGYRNKATAARMTGQGVVAGIPDLCYVFGGKAHFIELKKKAGRLSEAQKQVATAFSAQGVCVHIVRDFEAFMGLILSIHQNVKKNIHQNVEKK